MLKRAQERKAVTSLKPVLDLVFLKIVQRVGYLQQYQSVTSQAIWREKYTLGLVDEVVQNSIA